MKKLLLVVALSALSTATWANPPGSGETNGNGCVENCGNGGSNGGNGGSGGNGGNGGVGGAGGNGSATAVGVASSVAGANAGALAGSSSSASASNLASGGSATSGSNHNDIRSFALSGGSVGSPANDTCASNASIFFGLATFPVTIATCLAERQALLLWSFGQKEAALERLCAIPEVAATSACPKPAAQ